MISMNSVNRSLNRVKSTKEWLYLVILDVGQDNLCAWYSYVESTLRNAENLGSKHSNFWIIGAVSSSDRFRNFWQLESEHNYYVGIRVQIKSLFIFSLIAHVLRVMVTSDLDSHCIFTMQETPRASTLLQSASFPVGLLQMPEVLCSIPFPMAWCGKPRISFPLSASLLCCPGHIYSMITRHHSILYHGTFWQFTYFRLYTARMWHQKRTYVLILDAQAAIKR